MLKLARRALHEHRLLDELIEKIRWCFRAARYPIPSPQELQQMLTEHFRDGEPGS